jgi:predicted HicB family RNase H-like nuclease
MMNYKGYIGIVTFDDEANIFHGEVINTRDVITFQGTCVEDLRTAFIDSVEDYLDFCAQRGEKPDKPFTGKLVLRMDPKTHERVHIKAKITGVSLNEWINRTIQKELSSES